jgi:hypothetical protein
MNNSNLEADVNNLKLTVARHDEKFSGYTRVIDRMQDEMVTKAELRSEFSNFRASLRNDIVAGVEEGQKNWWNRQMRNVFIGLLVLAVPVILSNVLPKI